MRHRRAEPAIEAAMHRAVRWHVAEVPLARHGGAVAHRAQEFGQGHLAQWQPAERVRVEVGVDSGAQPVPPRHERRAGRCAHRGARVEVGQPQAARPLHNERCGVPVRGVSVSERWHGAMAGCARGEHGTVRWQGARAGGDQRRPTATGAACDRPQRRNVWRSGRACMREGVRTSAAVRGVSSPPSSEAACLAAPCKFQDQSPKPVSSTLKSTKLGRELRSEADSRPAIVLRARRGHSPTSHCHQRRMPNFRPSERLLITRAT